MVIRLTSPDGEIIEFEDDGDFAPSDKFIAEILGYTERQVGEFRREMKKLPSQAEYLAHGGRRVTFVGFQKFMRYKGTDAYLKERAKIDKIKGKRQVGFA